MLSLARTYKLFFNTWRELYPYDKGGSFASIREKPKFSNISTARNFLWQKIPEVSIEGGYERK
jgi:hypothetical protein